MIEVKKLSEQEIIEAKKEIANALKIDEKYIYYGVSDSKEFIITDAYVKLENGGVAFDNLNTKILTIPTFFDVAIFIKYPINFFYCEFPYSLGSFRFFTEKFYALSFDHCNFLSPTYLNHLSTYACIFSFCHFKEDFELNHIEIEKVYFENCIFEKRAVFKGTTFGGDISLYGSTFNQCPNFAQCRFEGELNLVNTNLAFDFKDTEKQINLASKNNNNHFVANDFRDSFRLFKNALSKEGNLLDASNYHRVELYCKEIELDSKPDKKPQDKIDKWQLWFYRQTSEHHTNLAKIINSVIMLIALFGTFAFELNSLATHDFSTSNIPQKFIFGMLSKTPHSVAFLSLGLLLGIGILTEIWKICKTHLKGIFLSFLWRSIPSMVLFLILCVLVCESFALLPFWLQEMIFIFVLCFSFVGIYLFLLWRESKVWIAISYIISSGILLFKPTLLLPFVGQLFDEGLKTNFPAMQSLSVVYCILMVLMIFSLQKTARKNSIVPS